MKQSKSEKQNCITILGTGTSTGIPLIGCSCKVCTSLDHRDQRLRTSIFIQTPRSQFLVDTTPDLRTQLLRDKISHLDFAIITHEHADHLHGIDDLRPFCFGPPVREIPIYVHPEAKQIIEERFEYIFNNPRPVIGGGIPRLKSIAVPLMQETIQSKEKFVFFDYPHGHGKTMGFVHEKFAYIIDCGSIPESLLSFLSEQKLDLLIIDCLQRKAHKTHLNVDQSFQYIKKIGARQTGLIHMGHDLSHRMLSSMAQAAFGPSVFPLYDQQKVFY